MILALFACTEPDPAKDSPVDSVDSADSAVDSADTDTGPPPSCPTPGELPTLDTETWTPAGAVPATGIRTFGSAQATFPVYVGSILTGMWRREDATEGWLNSPVPQTHTFGQLAVDPDDSDRVFRSNGGILMRSEDGGLTWTELAAGAIDAPEHLVYAVGAAPPLVWAVRMDGTVYYSEDDGDTFTTPSMVPGVVMGDMMNPYDHTWHILAPTATDVHVYFSDGHLLSQADPGATAWTALRDDVIDTGSVIRVGDTVLVGTSAGYSTLDPATGVWTDETPGFAVTQAAWDPATGALALYGDGRLVVDGVEGTVPAAATALGYAGGWLLLGHEDGVWASADGGQTWEDWHDGLEDPGSAVLVPWPDCPGYVLVGSRCSGGVVASTDWGSSWTANTTAFFHYVMGIHLDPMVAGRAWTVSDNNLLETDDYGTTWAVTYARYHFHGFAADPLMRDRILMGSVGSGSDADPDGAHVYVSYDAGLSWSDSTGGVDLGESSAHTLLFWPGNPEVVLLGTYKGEDWSHLDGSGVGLFRSTDRGDTWTKVDTGDELDFSWLVAGPDGVWAASGDGLWHSEDEGATWARADVDGEFVGLDWSGDTGLALTSSMAVWRSDDGGATWREFDDGLLPDTSPLGMVAIDPSGTLAWVTDYNHGVYRIGL